MPRRTLIVRGPTYWSQKDESIFFEWLQSISCVGKIGGHLRSMHIPLKRAPSDSQLRELIALFQRYHMNMKCLAELKTPRNIVWFDDKKMFWHGRVFGRNRSRKQPSP